MAQKRAAIVFSGGPDSTAAALWALANGLAPTLLTFRLKGEQQYGELFSAMKIADLLHLPHAVIDFTSPMASFHHDVVILMHAGTPRGKADTSVDHRVPFGAGMILSTAAAWASYHGIYDVVWGATADDAMDGNYEYTDEFATRIATLIAMSIEHEFEIHVPFARDSKHRVISGFAGRERLLAETWSCKVATNSQCGTCAACVARRVAIAAAQLEDFTFYVTKAYMSPWPEKQIHEIDELPPKERARVFASPKPGVD